MDRMNDKKSRDIDNSTMQAGSKSSDGLGVAAIRAAIQGTAIGSGWKAQANRELDAILAERNRYKEALEWIADVDPDDLQIFHTIANEALKDA